MVYNYIMDDMFAALHELKRTHDIRSLIGELEHVRRHAIRSKNSVMRKLEDSPDDTTLQEKKVHYMVLAQYVLEMRRTLMKEVLGGVSDEDWCLLKAASAIEQLAYELEPLPDELSYQIDRISDLIWGSALGQDMTGCKSCHEDRENG